LRARVLGIASVLVPAMISVCLAYGPVALGSSTDESVEILVSLPRVEEVTDPDGSWSGIRIPGFTYLLEDSIGFWAPVTAKLVAVPIGTDVTCEVTDAIYYDIDTYATANLRRRLGGLMEDLPGEPAEITTDGYFRRQRIVGVRLAPLVYDPGSGRLRVFTAFKAVLRFRGETAPPDVVAPGRLEGAAYEAGYRAALLNPEQGRLWRKPLKQLTRQGDYYSDSANWVKVKVESAGVYVLTGKDLEDAGVGLGTVTPATLRMYSGDGLPLSESLADTNPSWMRQVPIRVADGGDGSFGRQDTLLFYGLGAHGWTDLYDPARDSDDYYKSYFSTYNSYWLTWGGSFSEVPLRMEARQLPACDGCEYYQPGSFLERVHVETDIFQEFIIRAEDGWYWQPLRLSSPAYPFVKTPSPSTDQQARVKVRVGNWTESRECDQSYYRLQVELAGQTAADSTWPATANRMFVTDVTGKALLTPAERHLVRIESKADIPGHQACSKELLLAWFEVFYQRKFEADGGRLLFPAPDSTCTARYAIEGFAGSSVYAFDVTDQFAVAELRGVEVASGPSLSVAFYDTVSKAGGRRYAVVAPDGLSEPAGIARVDVENIRYRSGTAYCVVTHEDLLEAATLIADFHDGEVVTTDQIYDEFAWGVPDVTAIRDFLRWRHDTGPLSWVLFLGDATWDYRGLRSSSDYPNYVPSYERRFRNPVSGGAGDPYNTDDWLVYLEPSYGDTISDFPTVGTARLPAASPEEAMDLVNRAIAYAENPERGPWQSRIILVADDDRLAHNACERGPLHTFYTEELADFGYPEEFEHRKIYLTEYAAQPNGKKPEARADFLGCLNEGALMSNFVGHGDPFRMAEEEVYNPAAIDLVFTGRRRTVLIAASCNVSRFDEPNSSSMAEDLLRRPEGGTIASLASTHFCLPGPNQAVNLGFVQLLFPEGFKRSPVTIGEAASIAKALALAGTFSHSTYWSNNEMYALFGDPAMAPAAPRLDVVFETPGADTLKRKAAYTLSATVEDASGPVGGFDGLAYISLRDGEDTTGYWTCTPPAGSSIYYDYEIPGTEIYRARAQVGTEFDIDLLVASAAAEGPRAAMRCFVTDGEVSGSGLLDSLLISGQVVSSDDAGPEVSLECKGRTIASGDTLIVGDEVAVNLTDESGIAIKGKSLFIPTVSYVFDDDERVDLSDSVFAQGDLRVSRVTFTVPELAAGFHELNISAFDNLNNLTSIDYSLYVGSQAAATGNVAYAYPNPVHHECHIIWEYESDVYVEIEVTIYTLSGRKIWSGSASGDAPYHDIVWGCTDMMGDRVANGTYLAVVEAASPLDPGFKTDDRIVVVVMR
jgi:hypothetical protein